MLHALSVRVHPRIPCTWTRHYWIQRHPIALECYWMDMSVSILKRRPMLKGYSLEKRQYLYTQRLLGSRTMLRIQGPFTKFVFHSISLFPSLSFSLPLSLSRQHIQHHSLNTSTSPRFRFELTARPSRMARCQRVSYCVASASPQNLPVSVAFCIYHSELRP